MKVLLVDDDSALAEVTAFALRRAGFFVVLAHDAAQAMELWASEQPQLILLDIQLPGKDGWSVCQEIRATSMVPIIMLTVRNSDDDIVYGFTIGADDYITKPFSPKQLIARAQAVLRRSSLWAKQTPLVTDELMLDPQQQVVRTPHGMINRGQVVPAEAIVSHVWGYSAGEDRALLKQLVYRLRQKIEPLGSTHQYIETIPGLGYTFHHTRGAEATL
jgi:DNA-binding response OmpR family regulator